MGADGPRVSALGLGLMGMADLYGTADEAESVLTVQAAVDAGVTLLDTADFYSAGGNEMLVRDALRGRHRENVVLDVKFGNVRDVDGAWIGHDARPASVKNFLAYSLRRLGTDYIDVYRPSRLDPQVPIEDTVGAMAEMVKAGHVRHIGLSEVGPAVLRRAHAVHPITNLQVEYSLFTRDIEAELLPLARELGIGVTAYAVLGRGLLSGQWQADRPLEADDMRARIPRFQGENVRHNLELVEALRVVAEKLGVTVAQAAIAWVLSRGDDIVPVVGARRRELLTEALGTLRTELSAEDLAAIEGAVPAGSVRGERYPAGRVPDIS
ncbi:aldo/keto reductase [Actinoplanes sp. TBRC 11911]|uniref:aldo/keto reductase n=1 Tax=Actinoplanes sp. TBRC 11911 TaxID=2729386 RepID=UPI00200719F4|nr:aldo/keto reductase [Actinoplanes sp. TBRC 11911]